MRRIALLAIAAALLAPASLEAQAAGILPRTTQLPASTRAMGMGDSYAASSGHADAIFYHPALVANASGFGLELQRWGSSSSAMALSAATQWFGGGTAIGLRTLQYSAFGSGDLAAPSGQDDLFGFGSVPVSERVATVAHARRMFGLDVGVALDLVDERIGTARQNVALVDVSAATEVGPLDVAFTVHDIGGKPVIDNGAKPAKYVLGAGTYGRPTGIFDLGFAAHVGLDDDDVIYGGGVELGYWPIQGRTFVARAGFQSSAEGSDARPVTFGFAFWGDDVTVEWAWRPFPGDANEGGSHRFGFRLR